MSVLTILGSPRKKGNTATVLTWVEEELLNLGRTPERVNLAGLKINGCLGCWSCKKKPDVPGCVQEDDALTVWEKMLRAEAAVFASPVYFWDFTSQMKAFIDRSCCLVTDYGRPGHSSLVEGRPRALLVTAEDGFEDNGELMMDLFRKQAAYAKAPIAGELFLGRCSGPKKLGEEARQAAKILARQVAGELEYGFQVINNGR